MPDLHLLNDIAIALALAFAGGFGARLLRLSPILGYLLAGMAIGPFTPGYTADTETLQALAELGVVFLMFGVGLHFNVHDLLQVKGIAIPGAILQIVAATALGVGIGAAFGLPVREGIVLGLAISVASTVVLIRALDERGMLESIHGRVAVGWLIVEDLATIFFLVMIPLLAPGEGAGFLSELGAAVAKAAVFVAIMLFVGARIVPWMLQLVARTGSRELFLLAVISVALGIATGASWFGMSVAIGAFIAGVVVSETETSHQAAADVVPFRDAFAVLFFVSVGMLLNPGDVTDHLGLLVAVVLAVVVGKSVVAFLVAAIFPYPARTGLVVAAGLAQIGEFSFIIAQEGFNLELMTPETYNVVLAAAVISIALNPLAFQSIGVIEGRLRQAGRLWHWFDQQGPIPETPVMRGGRHVVIAGYGRVGELTGRALSQLGMPFVAIDARLDLARRLTSGGTPAVWGDAAASEVLREAGVERARLLVVTVPDESTALLAIANARKLNPAIPIVTRARDGETLAVQYSLGASEVVVPEYEGGIEMIRQTLLLLGYPDDAAADYSQATREIRYGRSDDAGEEQPDPTGEATR